MYKILFVTMLIYIISLVNIIMNEGIGITIFIFYKIIPFFIFCYCFGVINSNVVINIMIHKISRNNLILIVFT